MKLWEIETDKKGDFAKVNKMLQLSSDAHKVGIKSEICSLTDGIHILRPLSIAFHSVRMQRESPLLRRTEPGSTGTLNAAINITVDLLTTLNVC